MIQLSSEDGAAQPVSLPVFLGIASDRTAPLSPSEATMIEVEPRGDDVHLLDRSGLAKSMENSSLISSSYRNASNMMMHLGTQHENTTITFLHP